MRRFLSGAALILIATAAGLSYQTMRSFRIDRIPVVIQNPSQDPTQIKYHARLKESLEQDLKVFSGIPLWKLRLSDVESIVRKNPLVAKQNLRRWLTGSLTVEVEPDEMVFVTRGVDGRLLAVTRSRRTIPSIAGEAPNLPLLVGEGILKNPTLFTRALSFRDLLPEQGSLSRASLAELTLNSKDGLKARVDNSSGQINFGNDEYSDRISRATKVLDYLEAHQLQWRVIDTGFSKKIVVRLRKSS